MLAQVNLQIHPNTRRKWKLLPRSLSTSSEPILMLMPRW